MVLAPPLKREDDPPRFSSDRPHLSDVPIAVERDIRLVWTDQNERSRSKTAKSKNRLPALPRTVSIPDEEIVTAHGEVYQASSDTPVDCVGDGQPESAAQVALASPTVSPASRWRAPLS